MGLLIGGALYATITFAGGKPQIETTCAFQFRRLECTFTNTGNGSGSHCVRAVLVQKIGSARTESDVVCSGRISSKETRTEQGHFIDRDAVEDICRAGACTLEVEQASAQ